MASSKVPSALRRGRICQLGLWFSWKRPFARNSTSDPKIKTRPSTRLQSIEAHATRYVPRQADGCSTGRFCRAIFGWGGVRIASDDGTLVACFSVSPVPPSLVGETGYGAAALPAVIIACIRSANSRSELCCGCRLVDSLVIALLAQTKKNTTDCTASIPNVP